MSLSFRQRAHAMDMEGPEYNRVTYKRLRALVEGFIGRVKGRLGYGRLTWQGLENVSIHVSLVLIAVYPRQRGRIRVSLGEALSCIR